MREPEIVLLFFLSAVWASRCRVIYYRALRALQLLSLELPPSSCLRNIVSMREPEIVLLFFLGEQRPSEPVGNCVVILSGRTAALRAGPEIVLLFFLGEQRPSEPVRAARP